MIVKYLLINPFLIFPPCHASKYSLLVIVKKKIEFSDDLFRFIV